MSGLADIDDPRVLAGAAHNEDAAVLTFPEGKGLVQTVDFLTPIVNDPYRFGQIAAANALSDVYAMGGEPYAAMNVVCFPIKKMGPDMLRDILRGGADKVRESGAVLVGGHSVEDDEIKYGLCVSGVVDPERISSNAGLRPGDRLILTKPLGTGVLSTAIKGRVGDTQALEDELFRWAGRLNGNGGKVISELGLLGATDVTGFGLGGHILEMVRASEVDVELLVDEAPLFGQTMELAAMGMFPAGGFANKKHCSSRVSIAPGLDGIKVDLVFDAQTSGGLVLSVPESQVDRAREMLLAAGDLAAIIGKVLPLSDTGNRKGRLFLK